MTHHTVDRLVLTQGTIHDPATGRDGVVDDVWIEGGTIVARPADSAGFRRIEARTVAVSSLVQTCRATGPCDRFPAWSRLK